MISHIGAIPQGAEGLVKRFDSNEEIRSFLICNNTAGDLTYSLKFRPRDTVDSNEFRVFYLTPIRAGETHVIQMYDIKLGEGEAIYGLATGAVNICIMSV